MPYRNYSGFDDAAMKAMSAAYDAAIAKLGLKLDDPLTSNIAARIAAFASEGQRDSAKMCDEAVAGLAK